MALFECLQQFVLVAKASVKTADRGLGAPRYLRNRESGEALLGDQLLGRFEEAVEGLLAPGLLGAGDGP